ncbi:MAG: N-6 DNA methylase [Spirochaetes bacterium]|nr:N-6 DNA methylase [Spirochaetota bacterium]
MTNEERIAALRTLVATFRDNIVEYKEKGYKEAKVRQDFINKFFKLLDWDIDNDGGKSEQYRDVIIEDSIEIAGAQKAPDYCFKIGKERKFFVEAKKPSVSVKDEHDPAYQVRRYGYTANLPLSILTDFEEFAVYDTRIKPAKIDKSGVGRIFYCTYEDYEKQLDFIYSTFSKTAIEKGSFDKYVHEAKSKRGSESVDKGLLSLIEGFRVDLAKNIAKLNKKLDIYQLNHAVTKIIDRIIFLRIAEDKDVEKYGILLNAVTGTEKKGTRGLSPLSSKIKAIFKAANEKYNSELFKAHETIDTAVIDDDVLKDIITALYYPDCPYELSVLPLEILGNIYEQFLGKTIRLTESHLAKIEEKPEVRKAGGVYYTPQYIVEYIVKNTVGSLTLSPALSLSQGTREGEGANTMGQVTSKTPEEVSKLRICDPACGSGSFLIGAYDYLLEWHYKYYADEKNIEQAIKEKRIYKYSKGYRLTIEEKKRILINNIYGVDIDPQAVEVTKLSLVLKILEGENAESAGTLLTYSSVKMLPDLSNNIKCGNSLIGSDFYKDKQMDMFDTAEMRKVNAFDWEKEFPAVFAAGGFDVVIGNPPYGGLLSDSEKEYLCKSYSSYEYQLNSFCFFMEKGVRYLRTDGLLSFIVPAVFLNQHYFMNIRNIILKKTTVKHLVLLNYKVFEQADTGDTCIFIVENSNIQADLKYSTIRDRELFLCPEKGTTNQTIFLNNKRFEFIFSKHDKLINKVFDRSVKLGDIAFCTMGIKPYQTGKGKPKQTKTIVDERPYDSEKKKNELYKQYLIGKDIDRYVIAPKEKRFIKYGEWLAEPRPDAPFEREKIILRQTSDVIRATIDKMKYYNLNNIYNIESKDMKYDNRYLLGILNSKLMIFIYQHIVPEKGRVFAEIKKINLEKLPIIFIDSQSAEQNQLTLLVDQMLTVQNEYLMTKDSDKVILRQKIDVVDTQIDALVYQLYGLTEDEVMVVEGKA